jgi:hypothetical protein
MNDVRLVVLVITSIILTNCTGEKVDFAVRAPRDPLFMPHIPWEMMKPTCLPEDLQCAMPTATIIHPDTVLDNDVWDGYGAILLSKGDDRNIIICESFFKILPNYTYPQALRNNKSEHRSNMYRPTFWLDARSEKASPQDETKSNYQSACPEQIENYDYERSQSIQSSLTLQLLKGPYLVAWKKSEDQALIYDLSAYRNGGDFTEAFKLWRDEISNDVSLWHIGSVRKAPWYQHVRNAFNEAGKAVIELVKLKNASASAH